VQRLQQQQQLRELATLQVAFKTECNCKSVFKRNGLQLRCSLRALDQQRNRCLLSAFPLDGAVLMGLQAM
jgi:hypothetical protein